MITDMYRGRNWARVGFWVGVGASVAANVAHAFLGDDPSWLMLLFAALPPFALLVGIEVIAQVRWRKVWYQAVIRWGAVGSVAGIGGVVSYSHMKDALSAHGETGIGSVLLPLLVDGLMTVCSAALLTIGDNVRRAERTAELPAEADPEIAVWQQRAEEQHQRAEVLAAEATRLRKQMAELPAEVTPVRAPRKPAAKAAAKPVKTTPRRPVEETRKLAAEALTSAPDVTRTAVAQQLDITPRRLRQVLNEDTGEQRPVNGTDVLADATA